MPTHSKGILKWLAPTLVAALSFSGVGHSYYLDDSCREHEWMITRAMAEVYEQASDARIVLSTLVSGVPASEGPNVDQAQLDLFRYVYGSMTRNGLPDPTARGWDNLIRRARWVAGHSNRRGLATPNPPLTVRPGSDYDEPVAYGSLTNRDVVIYCNLDRYLRNPDDPSEGWFTDDRGREVWDPTIAAWVPLEDVFFSIVRGLRSPQAYTMNHYWLQENIPAQVQLNPHVLRDHVWRARTIVDDVLDHLPTWQRTRQPNGSVRLPVDRLGRFLDVLLLHELGHTATGSAFASDVEGENSYKWENIRRIGRTTNAVANADSAAYFAMGAHLIKHNVRPTRLMDDGTFQLLDAA